MTTELKDYSKLRWEDLLRFGSAPWDYQGTEDNSLEAQGRVLRDMRSLIGRPSLEAIRYLWQQYSALDSNLAAVVGCFYYYNRPQDKAVGEQIQQGVVMPIEWATSSLTMDWIDMHRARLREEWGKPASFSIIGGLLTQFEWDSLQSHQSWMKDGIYWDVHGLSRGIFEMCEYGLAFADLDMKLTNGDAILTSASEQLGSPFFVADTTRGHHLLFPALYHFTSHQNLQTEIYPRIGRVMGLDQDPGFHRYIHRVTELGLPSMRVSPGLNRPETPTLSAVVWDGKNVFRD